ncbi:UNVERIFIED_CONTAM: hypothetical protein K2H54_001585 [Gekko kuhli]
MGILAFPGGKVFGESLEDLLTETKVKKEVMPFIYKREDRWQRDYGPQAFPTERFCDLDQTPSNRHGPNPSLTSEPQVNTTVQPKRQQPPVPELTSQSLSAPSRDSAHRMPSDSLLEVAAIEPVPLSQ